MKNFISINIIYLVHKSRLGQDDFGIMFDLKRGAINSYCSNKALPKIETIQRICTHFEITIDDFVNKELEKTTKPYAIKQGQLLYANEENPDPYIISPRYVERLEKTIQDKEKIITMLEEKLETKKIPNDKDRGLQIIDEIEQVAASKEKSIK